MKVVVLSWSDGQQKIPVGIKLWRKGGPSKVVLAAKLLRWAKQLAMEPEYVLMDSLVQCKAIAQTDWLLQLALCHSLEEEPQF